MTKYSDFSIFLAFQRHFTIKGFRFIFLIMMTQKQVPQNTFGFLKSLKWIAYVLLFILLISFALRVFQNANKIWYFSGTTGAIQIVEAQEELPLNAWMEAYQTGTFAKIELINDTDLEGYAFISSGQQEVLFWNTVETQTYKLLKTKKSAYMTISDLGLSLTGDHILQVSYPTESIWSKIFSQIGYLLIFLVFLVLAMRFILPKWGPGGMLGIKVGKENKKSESTTKFSDIAGMDEVKNELIEIVDYLKSPEKYQKVGARPPKGVLLYGAPGGGKTLLARAVAGEAGVAFFSASGSEFMEMLVGMGAAKVRKLFEQAKAAGKAIIFIDEIDAIGKKRGGGYTWGHQEQEQTLNQILTEMDGFDKNANIIVMAATNRPDTLDPALLRAGRFDRKVFVSVPTFEERVQIFEYYLKSKKIDSKVNIESLAKRTSGLVGADIENVVNEASLQVAKSNREVIQVQDFEYALEKVIMWPEKKVKSMKEKEKKIVAYHELGHAVTWHLLQNADPIEKISIVRRGQALGVTWTTPEEDKNLYSKAKFLDELVVLLGGRAAEELFFGKDEITTGASNDFERATAIVKNMIVKYGMDEEFWPINYLKDSEDAAFVHPYSEKLAELLDAKIKHYLMDAYEKSKKILNDNRALIEKMCVVLLEKEYLSSEEFTQMMNEGKFDH